jgi:hypothetical protein
MFGRTANRVDQESLTESMTQDIGEYGENFSEVMNWVWQNMGVKVVQNSKEMANNQHPRTHLQFKEYNVGDFFYHKRIPKRF